MDLLILRHVHCQRGRQVQQHGSQRVALIGAAGKQSGGVGGAGLCGAGAELLILVGFQPVLVEVLAAEPDVVFPVGPGHGAVERALRVCAMLRPHVADGARITGGAQIESRRGAEIGESRTGFRAETLRVGLVHDYRPGVDAAADFQDQVGREDVVPGAADVPGVVRTGRDRCGSRNDSLVGVPHHVGAAEDGVLVAEVMVDAEIEIAGVIGLVAGIQAIVDGESEVGGELTVLELRGGVRGDHLRQLAIDQAGRNLVAGRPGALKSVSGCAESRAGIQQRHRIARRIAVEWHRRVRPRFGERIVDLVRRDRRLSWHSPVPISSGLTVPLKSPASSWAVGTIA